MTALTPSTPGLAGQNEDAYTQDNALWFQAPTKTSYGYTVNDLAAYTLVGRVTETGELVASAAAANDGSQNPIGVTTHAVAVDGAADSNSTADSNSAGSSDAKDVGYYTDGVFNFDRVVMGAGWTLDLLKRNLEANGQSIAFETIKTATPTSAG